MARIALVVLLAAALGGCGTVRALRGGDLTPYGGAAYCYMIITEGWWFERPSGLLDLPYSLMADTVLLPITALAVPLWDNYFADVGEPR